MEGQGFRDRAPAFTDVQAAIVGISFDTPEDNRRFAEENHFDYPLLSDVDGSVGAAYGVLREREDPSPGLPRRMTFLIRPDQTVARIYRVDDVASHAEHVLQELRTERG